MPNYQITEVPLVHPFRKVRTFAIPRGKIEYYDLTCVLQGTLNYRVDDHAVCLEGKDILLMPVGTMRSREEGREETDYASINFQMSGEKFPYTGLLKGMLTPQVERLLRALFACEEPYRNEKVEQLLSVILYEIAGCCLLSETENRHVTEIKQYIRESAYRKLSVNEIADHVYLHPVYCCNLFKSETGMTILQYLNKVRIQMAEDYLRTSATRLEDIPALCGFSGYKYFAGIFRKMTGLSPSSYRKRYRS